MSHLIPIARRTLPTHVVQTPKDTLSKEARKSIGAATNYVPRERHEHEALGPENNLWQRRNYRLGDGDHTAQVPRAGSMDAYSLPSKGDRT